MPVFFLPAAQEELREAQVWYESRARGLGVRFVDEIDRQVARIETHPLHFALVIADVRRAKVQHFPYSLLFRPADGAQWVLACFHSSRDPMIWRSRL